jgi:O-antigen/teichoic acid export membrane protein
MSVSRCLGAIARRAALGAAMTLAVLCITLTALGFLAAAGFILLAQHMNTAAAAAITGTTLLALALLVALTTRAALKKSRPHHNLSDWTELLGIATYLIRRNPKNAMLLALLAGAVTEYFTGDKPER